MDLGLSDGLSKLKATPFEIKGVYAEPIREAHAGSGRSIVMRAPHDAGGMGDRFEEPEIRAAILRVCNSQEFRRSEQCKRFLTYVCDLALRGDGGQINEYTIGVEIFHRAQDYSPAEDGVVRRQAHVLRKKLDAYYSREGRADKVRVELPVGHYVPVFRPQTEEDRNASLASVSLPGRPHWKWLAWGAGLVVLTGAAFMAGRLAREEATPASALGKSGAVPNQINAIWGPWLSDQTAITICLANSKAAVVHHVQKPSFQDSHPEHFRPEPDAERALRQFYKFAPGGHLFYRPSETKTGIAESIAAVTLAQMIGRYGVVVRATESRLLNWADLRNGNYILLGHNEANPWVDKLLHKSPFRLGDSQGIRRYIENTSPLPGEMASYFKESAATKVDPVVEYGLVSMLPGLEDRHMLLLVTGLDGQASQMASEFLSQPERLDQVLTRLKAIAPTHAGPWYFQFVLRVEVRDRLATRSDIVATRVLGRQD